MFSNVTEEHFRSLILIGEKHLNGKNRAIILIRIILFCDMTYFTYTNLWKIVAVDNSLLRTLVTLILSRKQKGWRGLEIWWWPLPNHGLLWLGTVILIDQGETIAWHLKQEKKSILMPSSSAIL